jgi:hypothetical protein
MLELLQCHPAVRGLHLEENAAGSQGWYANSEAHKPKHKADANATPATSSAWNSFFVASLMLMYGQFFVLGASGYFIATRFLMLEEVLLLWEADSGADYPGAQAACRRGNVPYALPSSTAHTVIPSLCELQVCNDDCPATLDRT